MSSVRSAKLKNLYQSFSKSHQKLFTIIYDYIYQQIYKEAKEKNSLQGFSWTFTYSELLEYAKKKGFNEETFQAVMKTLEQENLISYSKTKDIVKIWEGFTQSGGASRQYNNVWYHIWIPNANSSNRSTYVNAMQDGMVHELNGSGDTLISRNDVIPYYWIGGIDNIAGWTANFKFKYDTNQVKINNGSVQTITWTQNRNSKLRDNYRREIVLKPSSTSSSACNDYNSDIEIYTNIQNSTNTTQYNCSANLTLNSPIRVINSANRIYNNIESVSLVTKSNSTSLTQVISVTPPPPPTPAAPISYVCPSATGIIYISINSTQCVPCMGTFSSQWKIDGADAIPDSTGTTKYKCYYSQVWNNVTYQYEKRYNGLSPVEPVSKIPA